MSNDAIHTKYRPDIDGLRAIAVLAVVGFHAFPGALPSGFIGVDIFFVISGYLISTILFNGLEQGSLSIIGFYDRRIRRILPTLVCVVSVVLALGWFKMLSDELTQLGKHVAGSAGFLSNFILLSENGYFDASSHTKPLLHLWSLAIEEQFYVFWPLLLWLVHRKKWNFLLISSVVGAVSFALNVLILHSNTVAAFYLPVTRFWELMIGGILAYFALHRPSHLRENDHRRSLLGAVVLFVGFFFITSDCRFPGFWALLPCLGTFLIISAGPLAWFNRKILSNRLLVWLGLISYPLYLWHWPLLSIVRLDDLYPSRNLKIVLVMISIGLAWISTIVVEKRLRFSRNPKTSLFLLISFLAIGAFGYFVFQTQGLLGFGTRTSEMASFIKHFENATPAWNYFERESMLEKYREVCNFYDLNAFRNGRANNRPVASINPVCYTRDLEKQHRVFLWGDSHASQHYAGLKENLPASWQILQVTSSGCTPDLQPTGQAEYCDHSNHFALDAIRNTHPDVVVVGQISGHSVEGMNRIADSLEQLGVRRIIFTGPTPRWLADLPKILVRKFWDSIPRNTFEYLDPECLRVDHELEEHFEASTTRKYVSIIKVMCRDNGCLTYIGDKVQEGITSWDNSHLTPVASGYFSRMALVPKVLDTTK